MASRIQFWEGLPPGSVGTARKPKDANPIMDLVWGSGHQSLVDDSWLHLQFCIKNSYPPVGSYQIPESQMGYSGLTHDVGVKVARNGHVKVLVKI